MATPAPALAHPAAASTAAAAAAAAATLSPLKYAIGVLLVQFDQWKRSKPRTGDDFACDVVIDHLTGPDRDSFVCASIACGLRLAQVVRDGETWIHAEYTVAQLEAKQAATAANGATGEQTAMAPSPTAATSSSSSSSPPLALPAKLRALLAKAHAPPATPAIRLAAMQKLFDEWMATGPRAGQPFLRELAVTDLTDDERNALASAFTAAGFRVSDAEYDASPPCRVFHIEREAAGTPPPNNNERVLAIVADVNRQYTNWLVLVQCDTLDYSVWYADVADLSGHERALLCRLLECHGFRVTCGAGASVDTFFLHRHPTDDYGSDEEEEDAGPNLETDEMEEVA